MEMGPGLEGAAWGREAVGQKLAEAHGWAAGGTLRDILNWQWITDFSAIWSACSIGFSSIYGGHAWSNEKF